MSNRPKDIRIRDGKIHVQIAGPVTDEWYCYDHAIDSLFAHVRRELKVSHNAHLLGLIGYTKKTGLLMSIREGRCLISESLLFKLYDLSGIPLPELRLVANLPPLMEAHPLARKERKPHLMPRLPKLPKVKK